jgi:hypothetical protein
MFLRSLFWERTVLSLLEKIGQLPPNVQAEIATRVENYIGLARSAKDEALLARFAKAAVEERVKIIAEGVRSTLDWRWAAASLSEAWCVAKIGLANGSLNRHSALAVISAIESFGAKRTV